MKFRYVILIFSALAAGAGAQSSAPASLGARQPRIVIPYIEPPACIGQTNVITTNTSIYTVTNTTYTETVIQIPVESGGVTNEYSVIGAITPVSEIVTHTNTVFVTNSVPLENPYKNLKYCDFVLKAVSQSSGLYNVNGHAVLYVYVSAGTISSPVEDLDAAVFYQDSSKPWPGNTQRNLLYREAVTNITTNASWLVHTDWNGIISTSRCPDTVVFTNYTDILSGGDLPDAGHFYAGNASLIEFHSIVHPSYVSNGIPLYKSWTYFGKYYYYENLTGQAWELGISIDNIRYPLQSFANFKNEYLLPIPAMETVTNTVTVTNIILGGSIQEASNNSAGAIEVYPSIKGKGGWMKQGNPNIKWMCLLSNGIDFYRDPVSGEPVFFDVRVEWVDKIPKAGEW